MSGKDLSNHQILLLSKGLIFVHTASHFDLLIRLYSCKSPTENISRFLNFWLQPLMKALPSYLKNTTELIDELNDLSVEPDTILVIIDVKSI